MVRHIALVADGSLVLIAACGGDDDAGSTDTILTLAFSRLIANPLDAIVIARAHQVGRGGSQRRRGGRALFPDETAEI